ncbi:MAG: GNAT family N-acetyltransferase [Oxalobacter sp.]|nr:MAG: GNAT family N-acetyltransferase [Oxalobacter sp.]
MSDDSSSEGIKNILVTEASLEDAQLIADLTRAAWADKVNPQSTGHQETHEVVTKDLLRGGGYILHVNNVPSGSLRWLPVEGELNVWEVRRIGVLPVYRGKNLSAHMLEAVVHRALASDINELRVGVRADQPRLVDYYAAYGFELAPELEYPHDYNADAPPVMLRRIFNN